MGDQSEEQAADAGHVSQEVDRQDDDDQKVGEHPEDGLASTEDTAGDGGPGIGQQGFDPLLDLESVVDLPDERVVVLDLLQQLGCGVDQILPLGDQGGDGGGDEPADRGHDGQQHNDQGNPSGKFPFHQEGHRGVHSDGQEQGDADKPEDVGGEPAHPEHANGGGDPGGRGQPDEERGSPVEPGTQPTHRGVLGADRSSHRFRLRDRAVPLGVGGLTARIGMAADTRRCGIRRVATSAWHHGLLSEWAGWRQSPRPALEAVSEVSTRTPRRCGGVTGIG